MILDRSLVLNPFGLSFARFAFIPSAPKPHDGQYDRHSDCECADWHTSNRLIQDAHLLPLRRPSSKSFLTCEMRHGSNCSESGNYIRAGQHPLATPRKLPTSPPPLSGVLFNMRRPESNRMENANGLTDESHPGLVTASRLGRARSAHLSSADMPGSGSPKNAAVRLC